MNALEAKEGNRTGTIVTGAGAPSTIHVAPMTENHSQVDGSPIGGVSRNNAGLTGVSGKKRRGRPRMHVNDWASTMASSPLMPAPQGGDCSSKKQDKVRPPNLEKNNKKKAGSGNLAKADASLFDANSIAHVIGVKAGEDVMDKIKSFFAQGSRDVSIMSATGVLSYVTFVESESSSDCTLTYEAMVRTFPAGSLYQQKRKKVNPKSTEAPTIPFSIPAYTAKKKNTGGNRQTISNTLKGNSAAASAFPPAPTPVNLPVSAADKEKAGRNGQPISNTSKAKFAAPSDLPPAPTIFINLSPSDAEGNTGRNKQENTGGNGQLISDNLKANIAATSPFPPAPILVDLSASNAEKENAGGNRQLISDNLKANIAASSDFPPAPTILADLPASAAEKKENTPEIQMVDFNSLIADFDSFYNSTSSPTLPANLPSFAAENQENINVYGYLMPDTPMVNFHCFDDFPPPSTTFADLPPVPGLEIDDETIGNNEHFHIQIEEFIP